jgi:hypothetical protein
LDFTKRDPTIQNPASSAPNSSGISTFGPTRIAVVDSADNTSTDVGLFNVSKDKAEANLLIQGLGTTQRPTCTTAATTDLGNYYSPNALTPIAQQAKPAIWIVAQASSSNSARKVAGSQLGSINIKLDRAQALSRVMSWAGSTE